MKRTWWMLGWAGCCLSLLAGSAVAQQGAPPPAAAEAAKAPAADILSAVPADAWAVVCIRSLSGLDGKIMGMSQKLNTPPMSVLMMAKATLGLVQGLDDNGGMAVVMMPTPNPFDYQSGLVVMAPCADFAALTSMLQPAPVDEAPGVSKVILAGQPAFTAQYKTYALISPAADAIKAMLAAPEGKYVKALWTPHQLERFAVDDLTVWINTEALLANPTIMGALQTVAMMSGGGMNLEEIQAFTSLGLGLRIDPAGVTLGVHLAMKEGSEQAKTMASSPKTAKSMLIGLPEEKYILAAGGLSSKEGAAKGADSISKALANPMLLAKVDAEKMQRLTGIISGLIKDMRALSLSISGLPEGPNGLIGGAKVVAFEGGAREKCGQFAELLSILTGGLLTNQADQAEVTETMKAVKYTPAAETIAGVQVDHLTVALDQLKGAEAEWVAKVKKIIGSEGVLVRIAAVDDKQVAATFGGGAPRMAKVIELVKTGAAPLGADEGIKKMAAALPKERSMEGYLAVDTLMESIGLIGRVLDEPMSMPRMPALKAPAAMVGLPVGTREYQTDVAVPTELIVAVKDAILSSQGGGAPGGLPPGDAAPAEGAKPAEPPTGGARDPSGK